MNQLEGGPQARAALLLIGALALSSCNRKNESPTSAEPSASVATSVPAPSAEVPKLPWYVGQWTAEFKVVPNQFDFEQGGAIGWKKDEGTAQVGPAQLELSISEAGEATGELSGALGERQVQGVFEADQLSLNLQSQAAAPEQILTGTITGVLDGKNLKATLKASSGDSQIVRQAEFVLSKAGSAPPPQPSAAP